MKKYKGKQMMSELLNWKKWICVFCESAIWILTEISEEFVNISIWKCKNP